MTKTIEEAAKEAVRKEYLCEKCAWKDNCDFCGGQNTAFDCCECPADSYEDGFKAGANYVYGLPLSSRLNAEEKERVRRIHMEFKCLYAKHKDSVFKFAEVYKGQYELLESIFGADFFKEEE